MTGPQSVLAFGVMSPWLLAGGLALSAVPLLVHLLRRRKHVERPWAAMQFLQAAIRSQSRRVRLEALAVLLVRTALVAVAAAAVSQPYFDEEDEARRASEIGRERILVIDTSLSMSAGATGSTALDRAQTLASRIVESAPAGDEFRLLQIRRTQPLSIIQHAANDRHLILQQIRGLEGTEQRGDVAAALRTIQSLVEHSTPLGGREVIILSDFQRSNWMPEAAGSRDELARLLESITAAAELTCLHVARPIEGNLSVTEIAAVPGVAAESFATSVNVAVENSGTQPASNVPIEVFQGQQRLGLATVTVPAGEAALVQIPLPAFSSREGSLVARIPDDEFTADNQRWLVLPPRMPLDVLLVSGRARTAEQRGAADFVELALTPGGESATAGIATRVVDASELAAADLMRFSCVYLCNVPSIDEPTAAGLRTYVESGGGLVIALGDLVQPAGYRSLQPPRGRSLLPGAPLETVGTPGSGESPVRFAPGDYRHRIINPFAGNPDSGLLTTEIDRYWSLSIPEGGTGDVVLSFSTGDPAILEWRYGQGRVLVVTTPLDDTWSNWALWPSFVPMVHELTRAAAAGKDASHSRLVGDLLEVRLPAEAFDASVGLRTPSGRSSELRKTFQPDGSWSASATANSAGIHAFTLGAPLQSVELFAVNVDPVECRLAALDSANLSDLVPQSAFRLLEDWEPAPSSLAWSSRRSGLSRALLLVVLGLMLVDQLMTWKFRFGLAAMALLLCLAPALSLGGSGGLLSGLLAGGLLGALLLTLLARSRTAGRLRHTATDRL